jgi:electron transfer flavoprotein alpha subunit
VNEEKFVVAKSGYTDRVYLNFDVLPSKTVIVTFLPGDMDSEEAREATEIGVVREEMSIQPEMMRTRNIRYIKGDPKTISLREAELIVAGGNGIRKEGLAVLEEVADLLGASIGGTRPLVDEGIIPFERQIGITGKSVSPKLLLACGISGAREFTAGLEKTQLTIAVNTDPQARIFSTADMGVLGDMHEIVPALIKSLRKRKESEQADEVAGD